MDINLLFYVLICVICLLVGYGIGIINGGIHIHTETKKVEKELKYNESLVEHLPPEQIQYYEKHNGSNAW